MALTVTLAQDGKMVTEVLATEKTFSTGSRGFHSQGKLDLGGKRYQYQIQLVEIGSKPKAS